MATPLFTGVKSTTEIGYLRNLVNYGRSSDQKKLKWKGSWWDGEVVIHEESVQRHGLHFKWEAAGLLKIPSCYSEQYTIANLRLVYSWNFQFSIFTQQLTPSKWNNGKKNSWSGALEFLVPKLPPLHIRELNLVTSRLPLPNWWVKTRRSHL